MDQVLYPKMAGFQSQIEELVYSYLNIDRPKRKIIKEEPDDDDNFNASSLLPKDLEAVSSPESDKQKSCGSQEKFLHKKIDETDDDFESPEFEPLEGVVAECVVKKENDDSHLSGLSNMKSECEFEMSEEKPQVLSFERSMESLKQEEDDSQLSQISSRSRLSIVVHSEKDSMSPKPEVLNITEEAQMPKFNENSNSIDSRGPAKETVEGQSLFDFKKEEIEFRGPCRKQMTLDEKLQEEIYESENKHGKDFKVDDIETNSHSSDMKLEIVEQNITESESRLKIDVEATGTCDTKEPVKVEEDPSLGPPKLEVSENEGKLLDKSHEKQSDKKERSSHHKTSKSSKHSSKDREERQRSSSKHSSSHHSTSKSRYSDRDRHHSSSSKHKTSTSSGKDRDKSSSKDRHRSRSSGHKFREQHSEDPQTSHDKITSAKATEDEVAQVPESEKKFEDTSCQSPDKTAPLLTPCTPKPVESDEEEFYGFPDQDTPTPGTHTQHTEFATPAKIKTETPDITPCSSSQKLNRSFMEEDSFYGFDDATPKKSITPGTSSSITPINLPVLQKHDEEPRTEIKETGNGKRVRRPNTKYLSDDFTTHHDDDEHELEGGGNPSKSIKKRKKITQDIVKIAPRKPTEVKNDDKGEDNKNSKSVEDVEMPDLIHKADSGSNLSMKRKSSPETPEEKDDSSETPLKLSKKSKKHFKHDGTSEGRSSSRRK